MKMLKALRGERVEACAAIAEGTRGTQVERRPRPGAVRRRIVLSATMATLTLAALQAARRVIILATGAGKADAVARAKRHEVPSGMIAGARWLIDRAAAGQ